MFVGRFVDSTLTDVHIVGIIEKKKDARRQSLQPWLEKHPEVGEGIYVVIDGEIAVMMGVQTQKQLVFTSCGRSPVTVSMAIPPISQEETGLFVDWRCREATGKILPPYEIPGE